MTTTPRPWEQTIEEYLDGCSVGGSADRPFSADDLRRYADQTDYTHRATSGDYVFDFNHHQSFRITHAPTGEVAGTFAGVLAYVSPEHRGKNLTSRLYVMCSDAGISRERVRMLTPASLGAFRKAHAMMVERAVKAGDPVPLRVLSQYKRAEGGGLTLRKPYDRDACNARLDLLATHKQAKRILATTQDASFFPRNPRDADKDAEGVCAYLDGARPRRLEGLRLADAVAREAGGAVRMLVTSYHNGERRRRVHTAFAAVVDGVAIDAFGAGPEGSWPEKLTDLGVIEEQAFLGFFSCEDLTQEVRDFGSAAECVSWMRAEGVSFQRRQIDPRWTQAKELRDPDAEAHALDAALGHARDLRASRKMSDMDLAS